LEESRPRWKSISCFRRDAQLTVVAALLMPGRRNSAFSEIMSIAPEHLNGKSQTATSIDARQLLPETLDDTWQYAGSLTTRPCSQRVDWIVFNNHVEVAENDIERFKRIFPANARPRQPLNRRFVLRG
jgi:carbonic anhydrase